MTSSTIPAIYIQQFWETMCCNSSTGLYNCQLDEQWFNLYKDILRDALNITPSNDNNPFVAPPSSDTVIEYVNTLGYPNTLKNVLAMSFNALYQPWRTILSMINMCLIGKTAGFDRPRHPMLQILWGIIHRSNIDCAERIWEEFVQSIQTFTKLIIHHLRTKHNIHPRTGSPLYYSHEESILNTLRFVGKDGREIFGMPIPDALLTDEIKGAPYYSDYQEHVAKYQQFLDEERGKAEKGGVIESYKATKVTKPKAAKTTKPACDKAPKPTATQPPKPKLAPTQPSKAVSEKKRKLRYGLGLILYRAPCAIKGVLRIRVLERDIEIRDNKIENLRNELEEVKKEKESIDFKIEKFNNASKDLDIYSPPKKDLSWMGLPEFVDDTITDYSRPTPSIDVSKDVSDEQKETWKSNSASFSEQEGSVGNVVSKPMIRNIQVCDGLGSHKKMIWRILLNKGGKMLKLMKISLVQMDAQTQERHEHDQEFDAKITTVGAEVDDIAAET
ncbi:hypothetical protein Tco_0484589 [Tanacetum coccineum]